MSKNVNTILTITIILGITSLLIYGYYAIQKLDESKEVKVVSTISKHINYKEEGRYDSENMEESEEDGIYDEEDFEEYIEVEEEEPPAAEETEIIEEIEAPVIEAPINKSLTPFLVIAGSYKNQSNAETKVNQYTKMGISAEIVHLNNSKLHAICIARSNTEQAANDTMSILKDKHKIKAYVYKIP